MPERPPARPGAPLPARRAGLAGPEAVPALPPGRRLGRASLPGIQRGEFRAAGGVSAAL